MHTIFSAFKWSVLVERIIFGIRITLQALFNSAKELKHTLICQVILIISSRRSKFRAFVAFLWSEINW